MKIAEIFQLGYGHDRGEHDRKNHDHGYDRKQDRGYHHRRHHGGGLLRIYISL
jgi:hypothetical protein